MAENESKTTLRQYLLIFAVILATAVEIFDATMINVALPIISASFNSVPEEMSQVVTYYIIASAIVMPLTGFLSARLGLKRLLLIDIVGFGIASLGCGLAPNAACLIAARILQGLFGGTLIPLAQIILINNFSKRDQSKALSIWSIGIMAAPILAPAVGGYITELANWRWLFFINIPICILSCLFIYLLLEKSSSIRQVIDKLGLALMVFGICCLQVAIDKLNNPRQFSLMMLFMLFVFALLLLILFAVRSCKIENSIINLKIFTNYNFSICILLVVLFSALVNGTLMVQPLMLEMALQYSTMHAGLIMAPRGLACLMILLFVPLLTRYFNIKLLLIIGILLTAGGSYWMSFIDITARGMDFLGPEILQGLGMGLFFVNLAGYVHMDCAKHLLADASGLYSYTRMLGASFGISIIATLVANYSRALTSTNIVINDHIANFLFLSTTSSDDLALPHSRTDIISRITQIIAIDNIYYWTAIILLLLIPLVGLLKKGH